MIGVTMVEATSAVFQDTVISTVKSATGADEVTITGVSSNSGRRQRRELGLDERYRSSEERKDEERRELQIDGVTISYNLIFYSVTNSDSVTQNLDAAVTSGAFTLNLQNSGFTSADASTQPIVAAATVSPSADPILSLPSSTPTLSPTQAPGDTSSPSAVHPTTHPTTQPTTQSTTQPSTSLSAALTSSPTASLTASPTATPTASVVLSMQPTVQPTVQPTSVSTTVPTSVLTSSLSSLPLSPSVSPTISFSTTTLPPSVVSTNSTPSPTPSPNPSPTSDVINDPRILQPSLSPTFYVNSTSTYQSKPPIATTTQSATILIVGGACGSAGLLVAMAFLFMYSSPNAKEMIYRQFSFPVATNIVGDLVLDSLDDGDPAGSNGWTWKDKEKETFTVRRLRDEKNGSFKTRYNGVLVRPKEKEGVISGQKDGVRISQKVKNDSRERPKSPRGLAVTLQTSQKFGVQLLGTYSSKERKDRMERMERSRKDGVPDCFSLERDRGLEPDGDDLDEEVKRRHQDAMMRDEEEGVDEEKEHIEENKECGGDEGEEGGEDDRGGSDRSDGGSLGDGLERNLDVDDEESGSYHDDHSISETKSDMISVVSMRESRPGRNRVFEEVDDFEYCYPAM